MFFRMPRLLDTGSETAISKDMNQDEKSVSPYLRRPLRSLEEVLRQRAQRRLRQHQVSYPLKADNNNAELPRRFDARSA